MVSQIDLSPDTVAMSASTADRLIRRGSGDAALLYLYLLRSGGRYDRRAAGEALGWNVAQLSSALAHLEELGLIQGRHEDPEAAPDPDPECAPTYSSEDITGELSAPDSPFPALVDEVEHLLGRKCSVTDLRILLELYDHLSMPPEVLVLLTAHQLERVREKYGPGRRLRLSEVKAAAYRWKKAGIDTLDAADAHLKKLDYFRSQEGALLAAVGITGRQAVESERKYLRQWLDWGFPPEAVALAYEKTVLRTGNMRWPYCNGILKRWHQAGLHTPAAIAAAEGPKRPAPAASNAPARAPRRGTPEAAAATAAAQRRDSQWMQSFLQKMEESDGE